MRSLRFALLVALVVCGCVVALATPMSAHAFVHTTEPITDDSCWLGICGTGGSSFEDLLTGDGSWGTVPEVFGQPLDTLETDALVVAEPWTLTPLATVTLAAAALSFGYLIGNAVFNRWLSLDAGGLGTNSATATGKWKYSSNMNTDYGPYPSIAGFALQIDGNVYQFYGASIIGHCGITAGSGAAIPAEYGDVYMAGIGTEYQWGTAECDYPPYNDPTEYPKYVRYLTPTEFDSAFTIAEPVQANTGQAHSLSSGWPNPSTGACITTTCESYGSGPTDPDPQEGATQTAGDGMTDEQRHEVDCALDPTDYACPTTTAGGSSWGSSGGYNGSDGPTTAEDNPCKFDFDIGGLGLWNALNDEGAYDDACNEAWNILYENDYVDETNSPTSLAISSASKILAGDEIGNETVTDALTSIDPEIDNWAKVSVKSPSLVTAEGNPFELHFYLDTVTGTTYLGYDYFVVFKTIF
jgi:hypothetical protein